MITIQYPHMGINDARAPVHVRMWNTWQVTTADTPQHIVDWTKQVALSAPGHKLNEIVISCHGAPGFLQLGTGIGIAQVPLFRAWRGLVNKVWIRACLVGRITGADTPGQGDGAFLAALSLSGDGHRFCSELARALQCYLVVSTELQTSGLYTTTNPVPCGQLDSYEGQVLSYHADGSIGWRESHSSVSGANPATMTGTHPNSE